MQSGVPRKLRRAVPAALVVLALVVGVVAHVHDQGRVAARAVRGEVAHIIPIVNAHVAVEGHARRALADGLGAAEGEAVAPAPAAAVRRNRVLVLSRRPEPARADEVHPVDTASDRHVLVADALGHALRGALRAAVQQHPQRLHRGNGDGAQLPGSRRAADALRHRRTEAALPAAPGQR